MHSASNESRQSLLKVDACVEKSLFIYGSHLSDKHHQLVLGSTRDGASSSAFIFSKSMKEGFRYMAPIQS